jgi:hypothetical protein
MIPPGMRDTERLKAGQLHDTADWSGPSSVRRNKKRPRALITPGRRHKDCCRRPGDYNARLIPSSTISGSER